MELAPTLIKDVAGKLSVKISSMAVPDITKDEDKIGAFEKILQHIKSSDKIKYPELHDKMIQEFIKLPNSNVDFKVTSTNIINTSELTASSDKFSQELLYMEYSPNGHYAVGVTRSGEVILMDISDKKNGDVNLFNPLPSIPANKTVAKKRDVDSEDYVPSEDPVTKYNPKTYMTPSLVAPGAKAKKDADRAEPKIEVKPQDLLLSFSTSSFLLAVARYNQIYVFNCNLAMNVSDWKNEGKAALYMIDLTDGPDESADLRFMYFHCPSFNGQRYPTVDVEMLVTGFKRGVKVAYFPKDNINLNSSDFNMKEWPEPYSVEKYMGGFEGTNVYNEAMREAERLEFYTNKGNYIYYIKKKGSQTYLMGYKIKWDNPSGKRRFAQKFEFKLNENINIFQKTFSPDGKSVFAYNKKSSQVQRLKLDTTNQHDEIYTLTGSKKNFKHLAVKDDGKYLLIVDSNYRVEVLLKSNNDYANLVTFNASPALEQTSFLRLRAIHGLKHKSQEESEIEHDVSNMEFLEDGSGIVSSNVNSCIVWHLQLPLTRLNGSIYLKDHYYPSNFRERRDGTYFIEYPVQDTVNHRKMIDFNPDTNKGCIVRTFYQSEIDPDPKCMFSLDVRLYAKNVKTKNLQSQGYGNHTDQFKQLKDFLTNEDQSSTLLFKCLPNSDRLIVFFIERKSIVCFEKKEMADNNIKMRDSPNFVWSKSFSELKKASEYKYSKYDFIGELDKWKRHSPVHVDCEGKYFVTIWKKDEGDKFLAIVTSTETGENICMIEDVHAAQPVVGQRLITIQHDLETIEKLKNDEIIVPGNCKATLRVYDIATKMHTPGEHVVNSNYVHMVDSIKFTERTVVTEDTSGDYALLVADNTALLFDLVKKKEVSKSIKVCDIDEKIPVSNEFLTNCVLVSPDKKYAVLSCIEDCENITLLQIKDGSFHSKLIQLKTKNDRINRWCFSQDSKFFLVKAGNGINVYKLNDSAGYEMIGVVPIDDAIIKSGRVMAINLRNNSEDLEIVFGYKNHIFFHRVPFYSRVEDMMLSMIHIKMKEYFSDITSVSVQKRASNIGLIMAHQPAYQRRMDDTYVKILAMCDNARVLEKYFSYQKEDADIIFKYKSFASIILMNTKDEKQREVLKMHQNASNSFIDLMEKYVDRKQRFPDVDRNLLESWLKSEKLDITYMGKLLKLITFEPVSTELAGELRHEDKLATSLNRFSSKDGILQSSELWIPKAIEELVDQDSTTMVNLKCYKTSIKFDLSNGSEFSLNYFRWMSKASDEDITEFYRSVIYYKWQKVYPAAVVYSCVFWILNAFYVAFMGFAFYNLGLMICILILNSLFIIYEIKCFSFTFKDSYKDLWNYYDLFIHGFSIFSVWFVYANSDNAEAYKYSWLRLFSFVLISLRAFTMLRIFKQTRYLIVMLLEVFWDIRPFLSVFTYIIFIYWFVCLVRPGLVIDGEGNLTFYKAVQQAMSIAFDNFDAEVDSVIVFITNILGHLVLSLVLLNYLIAIVNSTYSRISESHDLYSLRMLIEVIREFDCFFNILKKFEITNSEIIFFVLPQEEASDTLADLRINFNKLRNELVTGITKSLEQQKTQVEASLEAIFKKWVPPLAKQVTTLGGKFAEFEKQKKQKLEEESKRLKQIEEKSQEEREALLAKYKQQLELEIKEKLEKEGRDMEEKPGSVSILSDVSNNDCSDFDSDEEQENDNEESDEDQVNSILDQKKDEEEEYDPEGECQIDY